MVFDLFKKKPDRGQVALQVSSDVLQIQLTLAGATAQRLLTDNFALGYMFGFHDAVLQALGVNNQTEGLAIMAASYQKLLGDSSTGGQILRKSLDLQRNQTFMQGMFAGGQEATKYLREKSPPLGLASHLQTR